MKIKKLDTQYMLHQEAIFENIDDMLDMKVETEQSHSDNKKELEGMYVEYSCNIEDGRYSFIMTSFFKYSLN